LFAVCVNGPLWTDFQINGMDCCLAVTAHRTEHIHSLRRIMTCVIPAHKSDDTTRASVAHW